MPTITDITATSGSKTVTFKPHSVETGCAKWVDRSAGVAVGYNPLTITTESLSQVRRTKIAIRQNYLALPATADGSGFTPSPRLDRFDEVEVIFKCNRRSNEVNRTDLLAFCKSVLDDASVVAIVVGEEEVL